MNLSPNPTPTVGFAQPTGFGGAEQCSAKPRLRPMERGDRGSPASRLHVPHCRLLGAAQRRRP